MTRRPKILTLTMNPAVDLSASVERIFPKHKLRCSAAMRDPGGGGINVARVVHRFGVDVLAVFPVGGVTGALLDTLLTAENVPHVTVPMSGQTRENVNIHETATGEEYRFVMAGAEISDKEMEACLSALKQVVSCDFLVASGSLPPGAPDDFYRRLVPIAGEMSAKLVVDTSGPALNGALGKGLYMIKPSQRELESVVDRTLATVPEMIRACREIISEGGAEVVALTLGARGALLVTGDQVWQVPAPAVEAVGTVGSGDSFLAGVLIALVQGRSLHEACRRGVAAGAAALGSTGTKLCQPEHVEAYANQIA